jgi:ubiquinone/menaquinone biosynthesis C-methylase UbiE
MLHDFAELIPGLQVAGIDISEYAIENVIEDMQPFCQVADARELPFADKIIDVVVSINTVHNLNRAECIVALREIERVSRRGSFITVDAYRTDAEKEAMLAWNLTGQTVLHVDDWKVLFNEAGYTGDYFWFMP